MPFAILSTTLLYIIGPLALLSILFFNLSFVALGYNYVPTEELLDKDANRGYRNKIRSLWNIYCCGIGMVPRLCKRRKSSCLSYVYILWFALFQGKNTLFFALFQGKNVFFFYTFPRFNISLKQCISSFLFILSFLWCRDPSLESIYVVSVSAILSENAQKKCL